MARPLQVASLGLAALLPAACSAERFAVEPGGAVAYTAIAFGTDRASRQVVAEGGGFAITETGTNQSTSVGHAKDWLIAREIARMLADISAGEQATARHEATESTNRHVASEATTQAGLAEQGATIRAVGGNPEANVGAIDAVGGAFAR